MENNYLFSPGTFEAVKQSYTLQDYVKLQKLLEHKDRVISGYKAYFTKKRRGK